MPIHLRIVHGCFNAATSELTGVVRHFIAPNTEHTYHLALYWKSLLAPNIVSVGQLSKAKMDSEAGKANRIIKHI